jgi:hypothetical protein
VLNILNSDSHLFFLKKISFSILDLFISKYFEKVLFSINISQKETQFIKISKSIPSEFKVNNFQIDIFSNFKESIFQIKKSKFNSFIEEGIDQEIISFAVNISSLSFILLKIFSKFSISLIINYKITNNNILYYFISCF